MTFIEQSHVSRIVYVRLGILAAALFTVGTNAFVIAGVLPGIAASLHVSTGQVSYAISWYAIVVAVASPAVSVVLARMSRTTLMSAGMALIAVGTLIAALAGGIETFTAGRVVAALGGAALVPAATAAAPTMLPPEQRGRALAIAGLGFTLATAIGSPLGTALAGLGGWRLALGVLAAFAAVLSVAIAVTVRHVPVGPALGWGARFGILRDGRILLALVGVLLFTMSFNLVYVFSSVTTARATGGDGGRLAVLLLVYGVFGIVGNWLGGRLVDRLGSRRVGLVGFAVVAVTMLAMIPVERSLLGTAIAFAVWGVSAYAVLLPMQHRLVEADPALAGVSLSWYSTAMYVGIALVPVAGTRLLGGGASALDASSAIAVALAGALFLAGYAVVSSRGTAASTPA